MVRSECKSKSKSKSKPQTTSRLTHLSCTYLLDIYLNPHVSKAESYAKSRLRNQPSVFSTLDKSDHRRRRRFIGQAINEKSMREFEPIMMSQVDIFLAQLLENKPGRKGAVIDITPRCQRLGIDVVGLLAFGYPFKTQTEEKLRFIPLAMASLNSRLNLFMTWPTFHKVDPGIQWLFKERIERFRGALITMIQTRMALPKDAKYDLYSIVANEEKIDQVEQDGLRSSELWAEAGVFFTAGKLTPQVCYI